MALAVVLSVVLVAQSPPHTAGAATPDGSITGTFYVDRDRDGVRDADEEAMPDLGVRLVRDAGGVLNTRTDEAGRYSFDGLEAGGYTVVLDFMDWSTIRRDLVPTTTETLYPQTRVDVAGPVAADMGWRPILRSADAATPMSSFVGPSGIEVAVYNDVVEAREVHDLIAAGLLVGAEAAHTTVRLDIGTGSRCSTQRTATTFAAVCSIDWIGWLDRSHVETFHEYGHAWAGYHSWVSDDEDLAAYLQVRGIAADPRLGTSHAWSRHELIAEDYRQLFGSPEARAWPQENTELPVATAVPGLDEYLRDVLGAEQSPEPSPTPAPSPTSEPEPTPVPSPTPEPSPAPEPTASPEPTPSPSQFPDTVPPEVSVLSPSAGSRVGGTVTVTARVVDDVALAGDLTVVLEVDGAVGAPALVAPDGTATWSWETTRLSNGDHTLLVRAADPAGNEAGRAVVVQVKNRGSGGGGGGRGKRAR